MTLTFFGQAVRDRLWLAAHPVPPHGKADHEWRGTVRGSAGEALCQSPRTVEYFVILDGTVCHEALEDRAGERIPPPGCRSSPVEAEGSPIQGTPVRVGSGPDNAGTCRHCQTVRARQARREGVREEPVAKPRRRANRLQPGGYGPGCSAWPLRWSTPKPRSAVGEEATMKNCGVVVAMLPEQELGTSLVNRSPSERGNHPRSPSGAGGRPGPGQARRRPRAAGWGGGPVVVRARERRAHGEGDQQVSRAETGMPGGCHR